MSRYDDIDAAISALGAEATYDQMEYALRDYPDREVRTVLADRAAAGGGGAFNGGVGVVLRAPAADLHDSGSHDLTFTSIYDDIWNYTPLGALPTGLGLTLGLGGLQFTTEEAGTWSFEVKTLLLEDATWSGHIGTGLWDNSPFSVPFDAIYTFQWLSRLPAGAYWSFSAVTQDAATADPYLSDVWDLNIARLA